MDAFSGEGELSPERSGLRPCPGHSGHSQPPEAATPFSLTSFRTVSLSLSVDWPTRVCRAIIHTCDMLIVCLKCAPLGALALHWACYETPGAFLVLSGYQFSFPFEN